MVLHVVLPHTAPPLAFRHCTRVHGVVCELIQQPQCHVAYGAAQTQLHAQQRAEKCAREKYDGDCQIRPVNGDVVVGFLVVVFVDTFAKPLYGAMEELGVDEVLLSDPQRSADDQNCRQSRLSRCSARIVCCGCMHN